MIQILDISSVNDFDADKELATGTDGVIVKAGQGSAIYEHQSYIKECKRVGLPWGVYWLPDARYSPEKAKAAIKATFPTGDFGPLGIWLDCEKWSIKYCPDWLYRKSPFAYYKPIESIAQMIIQTYNQKPGIYTGPGAWQLIFSGAPTNIKQWFATLPLWTAQYNNKITKPDLYGEWKTWKMWQYQEGPDFSIFNGTDQEYKDWVGDGVTVADPPVVEAPKPVVDRNIILDEAISAVKALKK